MQRPPECPFGLDGEFALITGGATGIDYGIAKAFTAMGAKVVLARWQDDVERAGGRKRRSTVMSGQQAKISAARGSCTPSL